MRLLCRFLLPLLLSISLPAWADIFVVQNIRVENLQGINESTVLNYLPVRVGQRFDTAESDKVINALYKTGLFDYVNLSREGNTLVVQVGERSIIANFSVTGNKILTKDKMDPILKQLGLVEGQVFNRSMLDTLQHSLEDEYDGLGKYNARINTTVTPLPRNRVAIKIDISEGRTAQIQKITFIGNQSFSTRTLLRQLPVGKVRPWSFFTRTDLYSEDKLRDTLTALSNYYQDHGFLKFSVDSVQATLTPDRNYVYLIFKVTEGPVYHVRGYQILGNLVLPETQLQSLFRIVPGSVYSRAEVVQAQNAMIAAVGNMGYAFANVNVVPDVDDVRHLVYLTFYVEPGNRIYVRQINFKGNIQTEDMVLRRAIPQMEGGLASSGSIKESERQLNLLGYLQNVHSNLVPVSGSPDQVDVDYNVKEGPSSQATAGVGYGSEGLVVNAGINQSDFMGTGKAVGVNFNQSQLARIYSLSYNNPYYTQDGIQRGVNLFAQRVTPGNVNVAGYTTNAYGGTVNYSIPISARGDSLQLGYGYQVTFLSIGSNPSTQLSNFLQQNGRHFNQALLTSGWTRNELDRALFPTEGWFQDAGAQVSLPGGQSTPLDYYKVNYDIDGYQPIVQDSGFILTERVSLGYGNGFGPTHALPFFSNYYAGGIGYNGQVRGYQANTLGPQDSNGQPLGGNEIATGTLGLVFPNPFSEDKLRTGLFLDGGNAFTSYSQAIGGRSNAGGLRYSAGVSVDWQMPVVNALVSISLARALNAHRGRPGTVTTTPLSGDQLDFFQFNIGTSL